MLMAVMSDDRQTFAQLWHWTAMSLYRGDLAYLNGVMNPKIINIHLILIMQQADGDILIVWALLKVGKNGMMKAIFQRQILFSMRSLNTLF